MTTMTRQYPAFSDLPLTPGPRGNAWSLWGAHDELGTLNHLTPERVAAAAQSQIRNGERIGLNWTMRGAEFPRFQHPRRSFQVKLVNKAKEGKGAVACDDEWTFNTQISSQWDGCRHYAYQEERLFYMGRTAEEFEKDDTPGGVQHMAKRGIAGKALLVDWWTWKVRALNKEGKTEQEVDAFSAYAIPWEELVMAAEEQGSPLEKMDPGDVLIVRSGFLAQYETMEDTKRRRLDELYEHTKPSNIGVRACPELLQFLWDKQIAAVAGDSRSFERWPCPAEDQNWHLHQWLLAGWAMPIGELWDLETLSEMCEKHKRWTFFLSSAPMNVPGGVASPPNALAFF
ncbi:hypothetical protein PV08_10523 [Exophiala spinifera]|uniref:Cyclase n=1 Tax=Exophiala spinifera TaxID=91928 RepID=A0A0D2AWZ0_9EURO|nr:uncharacterized protein PV08_10523 [Exophiala spinifera]KIW11223.1 hypothetical protein PV08_10523 [Exophiala spinifera]